jgi:hypothetical protein
MVDRGHGLTIGRGIEDTRGDAVHVDACPLTSCDRLSTSRCSALFDAA